MYVFSEGKRNTIPYGGLNQNGRGYRLAVAEYESVLVEPDPPPPETSGGFSWRKGYFFSFWFTFWYAALLFYILCFGVWNWMGALEWSKVNLIL